MKTSVIRNTTFLLAAIAAGYGGASFMEPGIATRFVAGILSAAHAQGHDSGGGHESGGGSKGKGGSGHSSGGHDSGGHDSGGGPTEVKGHGTKGGHEGHTSGQHGAASSHDAGGDRFGGGSGLRGNDQVPEGIGRYGEGALSASDQGRQRYWGGWTLPEPVTPELLSVSSAATDVVAGSGGGPSSNSRNVLDGQTRCEGVTPGMPPAKQFSGSNLLRLNAARGVVDPGLAASGKIASPFLMGSLQDELTKSQPNAELAGIYLGLLAKTQVTPEQVKKIGAEICAVVNDAQAKKIAEVAESQRSALVAAAAAKP